MSELLPGVPLLHPRLRNSARNLVLLSGPDLRQWLYHLGHRLDDLGQSAGELRGTIDALRAELNGGLRQTESRLNAITARLDDLAARISGLGSSLRGDYYQRKDRPDSIEYWTRHNVTVHHPFTSVEDSLNQLEFRNQQYPGYIDLLPVSGKDGMAVLDYGCGPGHDLVGFRALLAPETARRH